MPNLIGLVVKIRSFLSFLSRKIRTFPWRAQGPIPFGENIAIRGSQSSLGDRMRHFEDMVYAVVYFIVMERLGVRWVEGELCIKEKETCLTMHVTTVRQ